MPECALAHGVTIYCKNAPRVSKQEVCMYGGTYLRTFCQLHSFQLSLNSAERCVDGDRRVYPGVLFPLLLIAARAIQNKLKLDISRVKLLSWKSAYTMRADIQKTKIT